MTDDSNIITITHKASGSTAKVHLFGATVISFVTGSDQKEHLFLSSQAKLDGSKAIRGGIPLVFPIFGPPSGDGNTMPQHGFARTNAWKHVATDESDMAATATLELVYSRDVDASKTCGAGNPWAAGQAATDGTDVKLLYTVRVEASELTTTFIVENTGSTSFDFNALLHTYLKVDDSKAVRVHGLGGYSLQDKVNAANTGTVQSYDNDVSLADGQLVDCVYVHPDGHPTLHATLPHQKVRLEAAGQVNEQVSSVSAVVWNPSAEKAAGMSDFGNDEWTGMVCVEPGLLGHQPLLKPGNKAQLSQSLLVNHD